MNPYYTATGAPANRSAGASATIRAEFAAIAAGLDLLNTYLGLSASGAQVMQGNLGVGAAPLSVASNGVSAYLYNAANTGTVASNTLLRLQSVNRNASVQLMSVDAGGTGGYQWVNQAALFLGDMYLATSTGDIVWRTSPGAPGTATEMMRLTQAGLFGVGTSAPFLKQTVANNATDGVWSGSAGAVSMIGFGGYAAGSDGAAHIRYDRSSGSMTFYRGTRDTPVPTWRIDSTGKLLSVGGSLVGTDQTTSTAAIMGGDATSAFAVSGAAIALRGSAVGFNNNGMEFYAGGGEAARITSSRNFLVGGTADTFSSANRRTLEVTGTSESLMGLVAGANGNSYILQSAVGLSIVNQSNTELLFGTNNTIKLRLAADGRLYGTALHNNAGPVTGTTNQYIASGTYTPTLTGVSNIDGTTSAVCNWIRVGNVVHVSGQISVDATLASGNLEVGISLPIPSAFTLIAQCAGTGVMNLGAVSAFSVQADVTNDRATLFGPSLSTLNNGVAFTFTYVVL